MSIVCPQCGSRPHSERCGRRKEHAEFLRAVEAYNKASGEYVVKGGSIEATKKTLDRVIELYELANYR